jgi:hypothetical protein
LPYSLFQIVGGIYQIYRGRFCGLRLFYGKLSRKTEQQSGRAEKIVRLIRQPGPN